MSIPDPKDIQELMNFIIKYLHWDRIVVSVAINQTNKKGWEVNVYYKNKKVAIEPLNQLYKKRKNPDTNGKYEMKNFEFFLIVKKKDGSIKLLPVNTKADKSPNELSESRNWLDLFIENKFKKRLDVVQNELKKGYYFHRMVCYFFQIIH